jgi:3-hydroxyacyl-[acyl-carrier-protein] dehydratase
VKELHELLISAEHPAFAGHFPGEPILPGALLLDEVLYRILEDRALDAGEWQVTAAKFLKSVRPGDTLRIEHSQAPDGSVRFAARVAERPALSGTLARIAVPGTAG